MDIFEQEGAMRKKDKILVSVLALLFSACATGIGYGLVGDSSLSIMKRCLFDFVFIMQFLATLWTVIAVFRKPEE